MNGKVRSVREAAPGLVAWIALGGLLAGLAGAEEAAGPSGYSGPIEDRSRICMIQDQVQDRSGLEYAYGGKKYYLCCGGCLAGFAADPERYRRAEDPVSGETVDKADAPAYAWKGRAYFFASERNREAFARDPEKYLAASGGHPGHPGPR